MSRDLNDTLVFVKVVEHGSFISAARALRLPKTTVSRKVQDLETRLGAQLLHRTTRKLGLTEAGNVYFEHSQRISRELDEAESAVSRVAGRPTRLAALHGAVLARRSNWIAPLLGEFRARHPEVRVEMVLSNESLDLIDKEIDVALRVGQPAGFESGRAPPHGVPQPGLRESHLPRTSRRAAASGRPAAPSDAGDEQVPAHHGNGFAWTLSDGERDGRLPDRPGAGGERSRPRCTPALLAGDGLMLTADLMVKPYVRAWPGAARACGLDRARAGVQRGVSARPGANRPRCARSSTSWSSA